MMQLAQTFQVSQNFDLNPCSCGCPIFKRCDSQSEKQKHGQKKKKKIPKHMKESA